MHLTWENYLIWKIVSYLNYELLNYYIHVAKRLRYCLHYHKGNVKHNIFYKLLYCMNLQQHLYIYQSTMFYLKKICYLLFFIISEHKFLLLNFIGFFGLIFVLLSTNNKIITSIQVSIKNIFLSVMDGNSYLFSKLCSNIER